MNYAKEQTYSGNSGNLQNTATLAQAPPRLTQITERLEKTLSHAAELEKRLDNLANRLIGSTPEAVDGNKEPASPTATVSVMERQIDWIGGVFSRIHQHIGRLENL